ncbi:MAG: VCBS repeat-containing protein, partial [Bacteroidia bacterium]|nr:VCBS repeat-containing protein [Bacteroidia bacterium]
GVTMVDIDANGYLDIYVCVSGKPNRLFINNKDRTFTEKAAAYGIDHSEYSTQAYFLDYDRDGDLDLFLVNHPIVFNRNNVVEHEKKISGRNVLYQNNGDLTFSDVSDKANISDHSYGLSASIGDLNNDGWPDIYVANDYEEPDCLYQNNKDGTFSNVIDLAFKHISYFSMGSDISDINNDGLLDLFVLDMKSEDQTRQKTLMPSMDTEKYWFLVRLGYHHQVMRNTLQLNNGNNTFSEIGQLCGVDKTDWSWTSLFADFDDDGYKDLFVTNGIIRDIYDNDAKNELHSLASISNKINHLEAARLFPSTEIPNYIFKNLGNLKFVKRTDEWGFDTPVNSNGAAFGDLDLDGDLDLVVNNINKPASIYENQTSEQGYSGNYLNVRLYGDAPNSFGLGAKIVIYNNDEIQVQENYTARGFISSCDHLVHFGLGDYEYVDSIKIYWPRGNIDTKYKVTTNQKLDVHESESQPNKLITSSKWNIPMISETEKIFEEITDDMPFTYNHKENQYDDYAVEILLPHKLSQNGPGIAIADVDQDGLDDVFIGGAAGQSGTLYLQKANGKFQQSANEPWSEDIDCEDLGLLFFDANNDGFPDLYVVSGGNEFPEGSEKYQDRLYINDGKGNFSRQVNNLPQMRTSGSCVVSCDYDKDGDQDLFVGGRLVPGRYPYPPGSYLLNNNEGVFADVTEKSAPELMQSGLVTSAIWTDYDNDNDKDLLIVGEWMPITIFENNDGMLTNVTRKVNLHLTTGWWNSIIGGDFDNDGDTDYVLGNIGTNTKYKTTQSTPIKVYANDFDQNGSNDIILAKCIDSKYYPIRGKECMSQQLPYLSQKYQSYNAFAKATVDEIIGQNNLERSLIQAAKVFESCYLENLGNKRFTLHPLPVEAQIFPVHGVLVLDINMDNNLDLVLVGNSYAPEVETGRSDAGIGLVLTGDGKGKFSPVPINNSGFFIPYDAKAISLLSIGPDHDPMLIVSNNNHKVQFFKMTETNHQALDIENNESYVLISLKNNKVRKQELYNGSGYLSQNSSKLFFSSGVDLGCIAIYDNLEQ